MIQVQRITFSVSRPATRGKLRIVGDGAHRAAGRVRVRKRWSATAMTTMMRDGLEMERRDPECVEEDERAAARPRMKTSFCAPQMSWTSERKISATPKEEMTV